MSVACTGLFREKLELWLPREALLNRNDFRKTHCYTMEVDVTLSRHLLTLTSLYARYSDQASREL